MKDLIKVYENVTENKNIKAGKVQLNSEVIDQHNTLMEKIEQFDAKEGWLCYQSEVVRLENDQLPGRSDQILFGELVRGDQSLHVQQNGHKWRMTTIDETAGENCLIKSLAYMVSANEQAGYHVYWQATDLGYQPKSYRFIGFETKEGGHDEPAA